MAARRPLRLAMGLAAAAVLVGVLTAYLSRGDDVLYVRASPDGREQLEFRTASRWSRLRHGEADMAGYVRLRERDGGIVDSPAFDLSGAGPTLWTDEGVQVGTSAVYDRASRSWSVD